MAQREASSQNEDDPYNPPCADIELPWGVGDPVTEAARRDLAPLESFAKAVGRVCYLLAIFGGLTAAYHLGWMFLNRMGLSTTPWPFHGSAAVAANYVLAIASGVGIAAGHGLRRLRPWSERALATFALAFLSPFLLWAIHDLQWDFHKSAVSILIFGVALIWPLAALLWRDLGPVLSDDYAAIVSHTAYQCQSQNTDWRESGLPSARDRLCSVELDYVNRLEPPDGPATAAY
jgi:hypothetical protein